MLNKIYQLEPEVTREEFDKVFDAHWHNGFLIRHLIYKLSRGDMTEAPMPGSPTKTKRAAPFKMHSIRNGGRNSVSSVGRGSVGRGSLVKRLHGSDDDSSR